MIAKGFTPEKGTKSFAIMGVPVLRGTGVLMDTDVILCVRRKWTFGKY
jgi:hypothetical protein